MTPRQFCSIYRALGILFLLVQPHIAASQTDGQDVRAADLDATIVTADQPTDPRTLIQAGKYAEAEALARELLAKAESTHGANSLEAARSLDLLVKSMRLGGKASDADARSSAERAIQIKESKLGSDHLELSESLTNLANLLSDLGDLSGAAPLYERALSIRERTLGPEHPDVAISLIDLGYLHSITGDYATARGLFDRSLAIQEKLLGPDHIDVARSLNGLGNLENMTANYSGARPRYERALAIREKALGAEHPDVATSLSNLSALLADMGDYETARPLNERAIAIREKHLGPDHVDLAMSLSNLAVLVTETGDYALARSLNDRALRIYEKHLGPEHLYVAATVSNLAMLAYRTGEYDTASTLLDRALAILELNFGRDHPTFANVLNFKAGLFQEKGDYATAQRLQEEALTILEKVLGLEHPHVAASLNNLANLHEAKGEFQRARALHERALAMRLSLLGPGHPQVGESLTNLANVCMATRDHAAARAHHERALAAYEQAFGPDHPDVGRSHAALGLSLFLLDEREESLRHALAAEAIGRAHLRLTSRGLSESQARRYGVVRTSGLPLALTLGREISSQDDLSAIWDAQVRSRALLLDEMAARHRSALRSGDAEVDSLWAAVGNVRSRLANLVVRGLGEQEPAAYRKILEETEHEKQAAERALAQKSARFQAGLARNEIGLQAALGALAPGAALLAFCRYDEPSATNADSTLGARYLAFVARRTSSGPEVSAIRVVPLDNAAEIDTLVQHWRASLEHSPRGGSETSDVTSRSVGAALRHAVWDPAAAELADASDVFIVPDGLLHLVSFAALPTGENQYLVETGPLIHYLSAERDLIPEVVSGDRPATDLTDPPEGLLVLGDPEYDRLPATGRGASPSGVNPLDPRVISFRGTHSDCGEFSDLHFRRLPGAAEESREIESAWKSARKHESVLALRKRDADETQLKRSIAGHRVVHLATHGFFLGDGCASATDAVRGATRLRVQGSNDAPPAILGGNPLLLSGLALTGANRRQEAGPDQDDGILTAEEVGSLDLTGTEWVVLSACGTGLGEVRSGEGVFGLRRAFEIAGAGTLIMSLWPVSDEITRRWMSELYRARLEDGMTTAESVRAASLALLARQRQEGRSTHPSRWAPFIASGDWR